MTRHRRRHMALIGTIVACVLVAACGSQSPSDATASRSAQQLAFSKCMRAHGVPGFPDPGASRFSGPYNSIAGIAIPPSIDLQAPAVQAAMSSCDGLLSAVLSPQGKPPLTPSVKAAIIANAQCMRTHGVPTFPDPTFPPGGGISVTDAGVNPQSPAYLHAQAVCGKR